MAREIRLLLLAVGLFFHLTVVQGGDITPLEEQLILARKANDDHAQIELLRRTLDLKPQDAAASERLVTLWMQVSDYDMAEAALNNWKSPAPSFAARARARIQESRDEDLTGTIKILEDFLATTPGDVPALEDISVYLGSAKRWNEKVAVLDKLLADKPTVTRYLTRANARREAGDYLGAVADAKAAQALEPNSPDVVNAMPSFERLDAALKAIDQLTAALQKNPADATLLLTRGSFYYDGGIYALALADAESALKSDPDSAYGKILEARCLARLGKPLPQTFHGDSYKPQESRQTTDALIAVDAAIAANARDGVALAKRAYLLNEDIAQYQLAWEAADAALALDPKNAAAAAEAIFAAAALKKNEEALDYLRRLEQMKPKPLLLAGAWAIIADMYFQRGDTLLCLEASDRSLGLKETERVLRLKATALQRMGRQKESEAAIKRAESLKKSR